MSLSAGVQPLILLHKPGDDILATQAEDVVPEDLGTELAREGGMLDDVDADAQQAGYFVRGVALMVQEIEERLAASHLYACIHPGTPFYFSDR